MGDYQLYEGTASFVDIKTAYLIESSDIEITKETIKEIWELSENEREEYFSNEQQKRL